jgi:hypothetical protein
MLHGMNPHPSLAIDMAPEPVFKDILLILNPDLCSAAGESVQEVAFSVLAAALTMLMDGSSAAWTVQPEANGTALAFRLRPLTDQQVSIADAWRLTVALRIQPFVVNANLTLSIRPERNQGEYE